MIKQAYSEYSKSEYNYNIKLPLAATKLDKDLFFYEDRLLDCRLLTLTAFSLQAYKPISL